MSENGSQARGSVSEVIGREITCPNTSVQDDGSATAGVSVSRDSEIRYYEIYFLPPEDEMKFSARSRPGCVVGVDGDEWKVDNTLVHSPAGSARSCPMARFASRQARY